MTTALGDLKTRLRTLIRGPSTIRSSRPTISGIDGVDNSQISLAYSKSIGTPTVTPIDENDATQCEEPTTSETQFMLPHPGPTTNEPPHLSHIANLPPKLTLEEPTPDLLTQSVSVEQKEGAAVIAVAAGNTEDPVEVDGEEEITTPRSEPTPRTESTVPTSRCRAVTALLEPGRPQQRRESSDYFGANPAQGATMSQRKIWVKRPGASATLVSIKEDDLVDDVRDMILRKYTNSLGKSFDAPDVTLRIIPRDQSHRHSHAERVLGPEESITRTLDVYYPGGQSVTEALIIDVPQRRTPKHSPRVHVPYYAAEDLRPGEHNTDYFSVLPVAGQLSPHLPSNHPSSGPHHAISVLNTGQVPPLPSPGGRTRYSHRPKYGRTLTQSPTAAIGPTGLPTPESLKPYHNGISGPPPIPTPPALPETMTHRTATPPPRISSPRPKTVVKKPEKGPETKPVPSGSLNGTVPPINVLIVEDNMINLRLLEAFMKRLKVRWQTAMDGREAVNKWRTGGFHLVLMDIQLPIMNGLEATKEIRRLERLNKIGVFSNASSVAGTPTVTCQDGKEQNDDLPDGDDCLTNTGLFKSPVIIVALTASSLQSDRHEALAAGCNDFLTKPVNFVWLERKVMEWGCMQALIDFDGWRKWKDFSSRNDTAKSANAAIKVSPNAKAVNGKIPGMGGSAGRREKRSSEMALGATSSGSGSESIDTEKEDGRRKVVEVGA